MKKSIIAAGAASVALAAMPIVGAFALDSVTDDITVDVSKGCTIADVTDHKDVAISVAPGTIAESTAAGSISVVCTGGYWSVQAVGDSDTATWTPTGETDPYTSKKNSLLATFGESGSETYEEILSNTTGDAYWAFKVAGFQTVTGETAGPEALGDYGDYSQIPLTTPASIAGGAAGKVTVNTQYKVNVPINQKSGNYEGKVKYTVVFSETVDPRD